MLLNSNLPTPRTFYIFIDRYNPMTIHNLEVTKTFTSAAYSNCALDSTFIKKYLNGTVSYLPFIINEKAISTISPYCLTSINQCLVAYDAEVFREINFPKYPSRLSAIYTFADYEICKKVSEKYHWDLNSVRKFRLEKDSLTRVIRVNMEIVSLARLAYKKGWSDDNTKNRLWKSYWEGRGNIEMELPDVELNRITWSSGEIFEYLIEGKLVLEV